MSPLRITALAAFAAAVVLVCIDVSSQFSNRPFDARLTIGSSLLVITALVLMSVTRRKAGS